MTSTVLTRSGTEVRARRAERSRITKVETSLGPISLVCSAEIEGLRAVWEDLQTRVPCSSAQTFDWARAWVRCVLAAEGAAPAIVVGYDARGRAVFLWPFELVRLGPFPVLRWLGQSHANYNLGLFEPAAAQELSGADMLHLLSATAGEFGVVAAVLKSQPFDWDGIANPFAKLPHQASPNNGYAVRLGDFEHLYKARFTPKARSQFARKERKLAEYGLLTHGWAQSREERIAVLDTFFAQKAQQFAAMGVRDPFLPRHRAFYREVALIEGENPSRLLLGYLKVGEAIAATFSGTVCHQRLIVLLSSLAEGEMQRQSPGALLLRYQIQEACEKGLAFYDIGVGAARHKEQWCDLIQPLFDSFLVFRPQGWMVTMPLSAFTRLKRAIKTSPHLWPLAQRLRQRLWGRGHVD